MPRFLIDVLHGVGQAGTSTDYWTLIQGELGEILDFGNQQKGSKCLNDMGLMN